MADHSRPGRFTHQICLSFFALFIRTSSFLQFTLDYNVSSVQTDGSCLFLYISRLQMVTMGGKLIIYQLLLLTWSPNVWDEPICVRHSVHHLAQIDSNNQFLFCFSVVRVHRCRPRALACTFCFLFSFISSVNLIDTSIDRRQGLVLLCR